MGLTPGKDVVDEQNCKPASQEWAVFQEEWQYESGLSERGVVYQEGEWLTGIFDSRHHRILVLEFH